MCAVAFNSKHFFFSSQLTVLLKMPVCFKDVIGLTKKSEYLFATKFVYAYPVPNPKTPLGPDYKFEPCFLPVKCKKFLEQIENFKVLKDDVWGVSFAKTGSTWSQEMIWLMNNDLDYVTAKEKQLFARFPFFEHDIYEDNSSRNTLELMNRSPSPRHLKTHLPAGLLPKEIWTVKPKIIYTARGVKDTAISYYHHFVYFKEYKGTMQDFLETFLENKILLSPCHDHFKDFWSLRHEENILFLTYEEMKSDLMAVLRKTAKFLGKSYSHDELLKLAEHLSFDTMKTNPSVNFTLTYKKPGNENCDANSFDSKNKFR